MLLEINKVVEVVALEYMAGSTTLRDVKGWDSAKVFNRRAALRARFFDRAERARPRKKSIS
jgi:hypothetical protein